VNGLETRHRKGCAANERNGADKPKRCSCQKPSFRSAVYDRRTRRTVKSPWGSKSDAVGWRAQALRELREHGRVTVKEPTYGLTVAESARSFLAGARDGTIRDKKGRPYKPSTVRGYERGLARVTDALGDKRLADLTRLDVQRFVDRLQREGHAASTVRNTLDPLRALCRRALSWEQITTNPTAGVDVPHDRRDEMRIASREEATQLLDALPEDERPFWATAVYAGLRSGELRALRWTDVDLDERVIKVRRTWDDGGEEVEAKSQGSKRTVPVVPRLAKLLDAHRQRTGRSGRDLVFGRTVAAPLERSTIRRRALAAWEDAGLDPITVHQCRHTCASFLIASGLNAKAISAVLGHASIAITFDRYGHLMPGSEDEARDRLDRYINGH
jgi:integrase